MWVFLKEPNMFTLCNSREEEKIKRGGMYMFYAY